MGGRNLRATRLLRVALERHKAGPIVGIAGQPRLPLWTETLQSIPPSEALTRPLMPRTAVSRQLRQRKPGRDLYRPQKIVYEEDLLRERFFKDHPWELARPRVILEQDGMDSRYVDWSKGVRQPGMQLTGECVVQRQLWLMENNPDMSTDEAYDIARKEFYALRHEEAVEQRIAREEARMVGGYFGKSALQVGMQLEDKAYEAWKKWAAQQMALRESAQSSAIQTFGEGEDTPVDEGSIQEELDKAK